MALSISEAREFIANIDLRGTPRSILPLAAADDAGAIFDRAKNQAQVVGSALLSFEKGVDAKVREAISDSALLAQLHANKQLSFEDDPRRWFKLYTDVLGHVGWVVQDLAWNDYTADGTQAEVNEKILNLLTVALGVSPTALAVITATINALKGMAPDSPWITLFSREIQRANMARFQIGFVESKDDEVFVSLVASIIEGTNSTTQVLFFKWKQAHASFSASAQKVSINRYSLEELGPAIRSKTRAYQFDYLSSIKDV